MNVFYSETLCKITDVHLPAAGKFDSRNKRKTDHVTSMHCNTSVTSSHINVKAGNLLRHAEDGRVTSSFQFLVFVYFDSLYRWFPLLALGNTLGEKYRELRMKRALHSQCHVMPTKFSNPLGLMQYIPSRQSGLPIYGFRFTAG